MVREFPWSDFLIPKEAVNKETNLQLFYNTNTTGGQEMSGKLTQTIVFRVQKYSLHTEHISKIF